MEKKTNALWLAVELVVMSAFVFTFFETVIFHHYVISDYTSCDQSKEQCLSETSDDGIVSYYKEIIVMADEIEPCTYSIEGCPVPIINNQ